MIEVFIFTDGSCESNPGPGGFGTVLACNGKRHEIRKAYGLTTNSRMELMAVCAGLSALTKPCDVTLASDSSYIVNAFTKGWLKKWRYNNWNNRNVRNIDLWEQILPLADMHRIRAIWVKSHSGNIENERCDELAKLAITEGNFAVDSAYALGYVR